MRANPTGATGARYFAGPEQDRLERQLTPETSAYRRERINLARKGLAQLRNFDHAQLSEIQRVSADLLQWQLDTIVREEPYLDYSFPLNQFNGVNVSMVEALTVRRPLSSLRDAENYVAVLRQAGPRMEEAIAEASRLAANNMIPPRFIIEATLKQMKQFASTDPGENPLVTTFEQRMRAVKTIPDPRRTEFTEEAAGIVREQVYPAWQKAIALLEPLAANASNDAGLWRFKGGPEA